MKLTISVYHLQTKIDEVVVDHFPVVVGRSPQADVVLEDRWVSRRHCELHATSDGVVVRDLGSRHGTRVNREFISEAPVDVGDTINIGLLTLVLDGDATCLTATANRTHSVSA